MVMMATLWLAAVVVVDPGTIEIDAAFLTAIGGVIVAATGLLAGIGAFLVILRKKVAEVHTLVNSHATDQAAQIESLTRALSEAGIKIPQPLIPTVTGIASSPVSVADATDA